ncbi:glycerol-3-phosphate dehydrogenase [Nocardioides psychrotolerans]|nr:glycerol-3-phosphate dehydrogenase [Nocardioides psychrotolerans]
MLVVGGGVTGAGAALDAASRGLSVALVEARDLASGTSSRSSKLFHGGLRYLEQLDLALVREALRERELMLTLLAPHLVSPVAFLYPLTRRAWERWYVGAGLAIYDRLGGRSSLPRARHLSRRGARALAPGLKHTALVGAVQYYDAQVDDARHTMMLARTAAAHGAVVRTSTEVVELVRDGDRVCGAVLRDTDTGAECHVTAGVVVSCTGVWTDDLHALSGNDRPFEVRASKGVHLLVARERIGLDTGLILRTPTSVLFVIPWGNHWIVGTTDTDWALDREHPAASRADIDYILARVNDVLADPLTRDDVIGVYAGLRPLLAGASSKTSKLSREHAVARTAPGLVSVAGGKYTTYRVMARDAVDVAVGELDVRVSGSVTDRLPLLGAEGYVATDNRRGVLAAELGVSEPRMRRLLGRYGTLVSEVLAAADDDPSLLEPVAGAPDYLRAEIRYAVTHEAALHLDDLLTRRTRISVETPHRGSESARSVAALVGPLLGWDDGAAEREVALYLARVAAELASQEELEDTRAAASRRAATTVRRTSRAEGAGGSGQLTR